MAPPIQNDLCTNAQGGGTFSCGGGTYCPPGYKCLTRVLTSNQDGHRYQVCECWSDADIAAGKTNNWRFKTVIAGLGDTQDLPRQEVAALTTPITPVFIREFLGQLPAPTDFAPNALIDTQAQRDKCFSACRAQWKREWWLGFYIWTDQKWVGECANKCMSRNRQEAQRQGSHPDMMY